MQREQVHQVFLDVPSSKDRQPDLLRQRAQVLDHRVQVLRVHPRTRAGEPVAQLPLAIALTAPASASLECHAAPDLGQGLVGQLREMEAVHHEHHLRKAFAYRGLEHCAHIDRHHPHPCPPGAALRIEPGQDRRGGALAGKPLLPPRPRQPAVDIVHISWHQVQVFKGYHAEAAVTT